MNSAEPPMEDYVDLAVELTNATLPERIELVKAYAQKKYQEGELNDARTQLIVATFMRNSNKTLDDFIDSAEAWVKTLESQLEKEEQ